MRADARGTETLVTGPRGGERDHRKPVVHTTLLGALAARRAAGIVDMNPDASMSSDSGLPDGDFPDCEFSERDFPDRDLPEPDASGRGFSACGFSGSDFPGSDFSAGDLSAGDFAARDVPERATPRSSASPRTVVPDRGRAPVVSNARVVRVAGPEDLLAYIPYRLGFEPVESVVAVSLTGPRQRVGLVARVDLADLRVRRPGEPDGPDGGATARWLTDHLVADGADRAVVVLYTATDATAPSGAARRAADLLRARIDRRLPGTEVWLVAPTGFRALDCSDPLCCPAEGRPLAVLKGSRVAAHMVLEGRTVAGTREERYTLRPAPEAARTQARRAAARWTDTYRRLRHRTRFPDGGGPLDVAVPGARRGGQPGSQPPSPSGGQPVGSVAREAARSAARTTARRAARTAARSVTARAEQAQRELAAWGAQSLGLWRSAVRAVADTEPGRPVPLSPVDLGKIGAALADTPVRDAVLLSLVPGTEQTALRTARHEADGDTDLATGTVMAQIVDPERGIPPDQDRTRPARVVLEAVVRHVPRNRRAPAYLLLALIAWWEGNGGLAAERVSDALGVDPDYRLALLLRSTVVGGVPPGWVRRERALFHGGGTAEREPGVDKEPADKRAEEPGAVSRGELSG